MTTPLQGDEISFPPGALIFQQGDPGDAMFVISAGHVRLTLSNGGHEKEVGVLGPGEFFGELSLLIDGMRTATARAVDNVQLITIGRDAFAMMMQDDLDIVFRMLNTQGQRLSRSNQPVQELTRRVSGIRIAAHCLKHLFSTTSGAPCSVHVQQLATDLGMSSEAVQAVLRTLAAQGVGVLEDSRWICRSDQMANLIEAIRMIADGVVTIQ